MPNYVQHFSEFDFDMKMGAAATTLMSKYNLTPDEVIQAVKFYGEGDEFQLEKLLGSKAQQIEDDALLPPVVVEEAPKPEEGYEATPRHSFMFVKPLPPEHKGRLITPKAYESTTDQGFVHAVGPDVRDVTPGMLVMFDKYAEVGARFELVDEDGDVVSMIQMREDNVTAILKKVKTKYAND